MDTIGINTVTPKSQSRTRLTKRVVVDIENDNLFKDHKISPQRITCVLRSTLMEIPSLWITFKVCKLTQTILKWMGPQ